MTTPTTQLTALLNSLAERAHTRDTQDFGQAIGLVSDLGRVVVLGSEADIRRSQAALSAVREQLRDNEGLTSPAQALESWQSRSFLAGALWAASEIMTTRLAAMPSLPTQGRPTRKGRVKEMVLEALASGEPQSPTAILDSILERDAETRLDEVSRALTEMLAVGLVDVAESPPDTDRRMKYLMLTSQGHSLAQQRFDIA
jgi:hypothetical protein